MPRRVCRYLCVSESPDEADTTATKVEAPRSPSRRRAWIVVVLGLAIVLVAAVASVALVGGSLLGNVGRLPGVFAPLPEAQRPPPAAPGTPQADAVTFLLVGTDSGNPQAQGAAPQAESVQLLRIAGDRRSASVVGLSRDTLVDVPGIGPGPLSETYATGGPTGLVAATERLTRVRVDHFAVVDFTGFPALVDALGGIDVDVAQTTSSRGVTFTEGRNRLDGAQTLTYVRQTDDLPGGDVDRVAREQNVIRAVLRSALATGILTEPAKTYATLDAMTKVVAIDDTLSATDAAALGLGLRDLTERAVTFITAPVAGPGPPGPRGRPLLLPDPVRGPGLWQAVTDGTTAQWAQANAQDELSGTPR